MSRRPARLSYKDVPKSRKYNVAWRRWLLTQLRDPARRRSIVDTCSKDMLFYMNSFVWIYEPRNIPTCVPFVTYGFQDELSTDIQDAILESVKPENSSRRFDILVEKSRTMGVTWTALAVLDWFWRFTDGAHFKAISRGEDEVDKAGDLDALFPKLDYIEERLPRCLRVRGMQHDHRMGRTFLRVTNPRNSSVMVGESANPNAGRGGRNLAMFRDEEAFASDGEAITRAAQSTTRVMVRVSTPNGVGGSFYNAKAKAAAKIITLHWSKHPIYSEGLYSIEDGKVRILDQGWHNTYNQANKGVPYNFRIEPTHADPGTPWEFLRSPWFDAQCDGADNPQDIAQELQISYLGSGRPFFDPARLMEINTRYMQRPKEGISVWDLVGKHRDALGINDSDVRPGRTRIWFNHVEHYKPPQDTTYTIGVDISAGTGASDSVICIADDISKRKVFEFITNGMTPDHLAKLTYNLYLHFTTPNGRPFLAWDQGGHGHPFGSRIMAYGNMHVYYYKPTTEKAAKKARKPGMPSNRVIKMDAFQSYRSELFHGPYITPSYHEYMQAQQFVYDGRGGIVHAKGRDTDDASDAGEQHGDIVTASVIMVTAMRERPKPKKMQQEIPIGCYADRRRQWRAAEQRKQTMWV